jgi:hypothetical protein
MVFRFIIFSLFFMSYFHSFAEVAKTLQPVAIQDATAAPEDPKSHDVEKEVRVLRNLKPTLTNKGVTAKFAYINKPAQHPNGGKKHFITYLVNLTTGKVLDHFPSLMGYAGMGCGKGQTPPGVSVLTNEVARGKSRKKHWGNNHRYYDIDTIPGVSRCKEDTEIVAHSNVNMANKDVGDPIKSASAGCFVVDPKKLTEMSKYAGKAVIYNVPYGPQ